MAVASAPFCVPTSSRSTSLLQAFSNGPGTYSVLAGPRNGQYQPCAGHGHASQALKVAGQWKHG